MTSVTDYHLDTRLVHDGVLRTPFGETSEALFLTQGFIYETAESAEARFRNEEPGFSYTRYSNPTTTMFEDRMASFEGAEAARATATGMAAVTAAMVCQVKAGDHVVAARALFGSCRWVVEDFLPSFGVACTLVDGPNIDEWRRAVRPETKAFLLETPSNPSLEIIDIAAVAAVAQEAGATLTVDNVFATPLFQKPLALGADCVVYSATKHIDGQGRCLGGIILSSKSLHRGEGPALPAHDGPVAFALQCLGAPEKPRDPAAAGRAPDPDRGLPRRRPARPIPSSPISPIRGAATIRRPRSSPGR